MTAIRIISIISWIARLAGLVALILGLLFWIAQIDLISVHIAFGFTITVSLLILSIVLVCIKGGRVLGTIGIIYALVVPIFGEMQTSLSISSVPWLVPTVHMLIGIGAGGLTQAMYARYKRLEQDLLKVATPQTRVSQAVR